MNNTKKNNKQLLRTILSICFVIDVFFLSQTLLAQQDGSLLTFRKHHDAVNDISLSDDGSTLLSAGSDNLIFLWNTEKGTVLKTYTGHTDAVLAVCFDPSGKYFASGGHDKKLIIWDLTKADIVQQSRVNPPSNITAIDYNPNGGQIATGHNDNTLKIWNAIDAKEKTSVKGHDWTITSLQYSPNGERIVTSSGDNTLKIWYTNGNESQTFYGHANWVNSARYNKSGNKIISSGNDKTVYTWDTFDGKITDKVYTDTSAMVAEFSPDGKYIATGYTNGIITLWELKSGLSYQLLGHINEITDICFNTSGDYLYSSSTDGTIRKWYVGDLVAKMFFADEIKAELDTAAIFGPKTEWETLDEYKARVEKRKFFMEQLYAKYRVKYQEMLKREAIEYTKKRQSMKHAVTLKIDSIGNYHPEIGDRYFDLRLVVIKGKKPLKEYPEVEGRFYISRDEARTFKMNDNYKKSLITGEALIMKDGRTFEITNIKIYHPKNKKLKYTFPGKQLEKYEDPDAKG